MNVQLHCTFSPHINRSFTSEQAAGIGAFPPPPPGTFPSFHLHRAYGSQRSRCSSIFIECSQLALAFHQYCRRRKDTPRKSQMHNRIRQPTTGVMVETQWTTEALNLPALACFLHIFKTLWHTGNRQSSLSLGFQERARSADYLFSLSHVLCTVRSHLCL